MHSVCNYTLCASLMSVDDALVVKIFGMETVEHELDGSWVDNDWFGYMCNLQPTQQSFFCQAHGSSILLHSSWYNVLLHLFFIKDEAQWGRCGHVSREEAEWGTC